jgi:hypothetical protein
VLFKRDILDQIASGRVTLAFRRWSKPPVRPGGALRTAAGVLAIETVEKVASLAALREADARNAGYRSRAALLEEIGRDDTAGDLYRVSFRHVGADPRIALRREAKLTKKDVKSVIAALNRLDQEGKNGSWTRRTLRLIHKYPARRVPDLAASIGRDPLVFKRDVRKLKELGLTEPLEVGFRISPSGRAILAELGDA